MPNFGQYPLSSTSSTTTNLPVAAGYVPGSSGSLTATQYGPATTDGGGFTSAPVAVYQATGTNLHVVVDSGSITDSGTVTANAGTGTFNIQSNASVNVAQVSGSSVATAATGIMKVGLTDGSGNAITSTSNAIDVNIKSGGGSGFSVVDEASWTAGTSALVPTGGVFNDSATALNSGQEGTLRLTNNRAMHANLRDASGNQLLGSKTSANSVPVVIASDQGAVAVSGTVTANAGSGTFTVSGTVTANAGSGTFTIQSNASVNIAQVAGGTVSNAGQTGALQVGGAVATNTVVSSATNPLLVAGSDYGGTPKVQSLKVDSSGNAQVAVTNTPTVTANAGTGTFTISGSVTANAGTNLNTSLLALESGGNLATLAGGVSSSKYQANVAQFGGSAVVTGTGAGGAGIPRVTISSDSSLAANQSVNVNQIAGSSVSTATTGVQKVGIVGNGAATLDSTIGAGTAPTNALAIGAIYNTSAPAPTNGQAMAVQADQAGNLRMFPGIALTALSAWNSGTTLNSTQNIFTNSGCPAVLVQLDQTTTISGGAITFEVTYDGANWVAVTASQVVDPTSATYAQISLPYSLVASTNKPFIISNNGWQGLRIKLSTAITGSATVTPNYALLAYDPLDSAVVYSPTAANFNITVGAALPAGGNTIGAVTQASGPWTSNITQVGGASLALGQTTMSASVPVALASNQSNVPANITQFGGSNVATGTGAGGAGIPRVTVSNDSTVGSNSATGSAVPANAFYGGGLAKTALPTATSDGQLTGEMVDKFGRQVVLIGAMRDLVNPITQLTLTATTSETTLIGQVASTFNDIVSLVVINTSATATQVDFRDSTGGTVRLSIYVPAGDTRGVALPVPLPQSAVNNNWTAKCGTSVSSITITGSYIANK